MSTSADNAVRARREREKVDVTPLLDEIDLPTLILHSRGDRMIAFEQSRHLAARIRGSRMVPLDSDNHIVLADEPAWQVFMGEVGGFLKQDSVLSGARRLPTLSPREVDIFELAAQGRDNAEIAAALHLSLRTVERHLQNVYPRPGVSGKAARTAAVARFLSHR
jgi:DNA-binding NarL/FixJ family response regulator